MICENDIRLVWDSFNVKNLLQQRKFGTNDILIPLTIVSRGLMSSHLQNKNRDDYIQIN